MPNYEEPNISFEMQSVKIKTSSEPSLLLLVFFFDRSFILFSVVPDRRTGGRRHSTAQSFRKIPTALRYIQLCFLVKEWGVLSCCQAKSL